LIKIGDAFGFSLRFPESTFADWSWRIKDVLETIFKFMVSVLVSIVETIRTKWLLDGQGVFA